MGQQQSLYPDPEQRPYTAYNAQQGNRNENRYSDPREQREYQGGYPGSGTDYDARTVNRDPREQSFPGEYSGAGQQMMMGEKLVAQAPRRRRASWLWLLLVLVILLVAGGAIRGAASRVGSSYTSSYTSSQTRTFQLAGTHPKLLIQDDSGRVQIHAGGTGNSIVVHETESARGFGNPKANISYTQRDDIVNINTNDRSFVGSERVDLDITVPTTTDLEVQADSGNVDITGDNGQVVVRTDSGSITANNISGQVTLQSDSGTIAVRQGQLQGHSILHNSSGSISFDGSLDAQGNYDVRTDSGSVDMTLSPSSAFRLQTGTDSGSINNDFGSNSVGNGQQAPLSIHTDSGSIDIHKGS